MSQDSDITPERLEWAVATLNKHKWLGCADWFESSGGVYSKTSASYYTGGQPLVIAEGLENTGLRARVEAKIARLEAECRACDCLACRLCAERTGKAELLRELLEGEDA